MFEDTPNQPNPTEPEDILAPAEGPTGPSSRAGEAGPGEIKSALAHQKLTPVSPPGGLPPEPPAVPPSLEAAPPALSADRPAGGPVGAEISPPLLSKKGLYIALGVIIIVALGAGTAWVLLRLPKAPPKSEVAPAAEVPPPAAAPEAGLIEAGLEMAPAPAPEVTPPALIDTDADGLTDEEEVLKGTNPQLADTDADGLTDYEELMIWKTNPLISDTDGDTYSDGTEVRNGYNPNGEGKLLEIPR